MPEQTYDLMLVLDGGNEPSARNEVASAIEALVTKSGGSIAEKSDWGDRPLAFEIDGEAMGDYRLVRFSGPGEMIAPLSRQLNITDGLLRHRVIKAVDGAPATVAASAAAAGAERPAPSSPPTPAAPTAPPVADAEPGEAPADEVTEAAPAAVEAGESDQPAEETAESPEDQAS
jgi:small subunit ribosomal protein S6